MRIFKKTLFLQTMLLLSIHVVLLPISANAQDATISQMVATYNANQARFHAQHRGKVISGVGTVKSIEADLLGTGASFNVVLDVDKSRVNCRTRNKNVAGSLDKGQKINFRGTVYDVVVGTLIATECRFGSDADWDGQIKPYVKKPGETPYFNWYIDTTTGEVSNQSGPNSILVAHGPEKTLVSSAALASNPELILYRQQECKKGKPDPLRQFVSNEKDLPYLKDKHYYCK